MLKTFVTVAIVLIVSLVTSDDVTVVSGGVTGDPKCLKQCVGLVRPKWTSNDIYLTADVSISECGFTSRPIITTDIVSSRVYAPVGKISFIFTDRFRYIAVKARPGEVKYSSQISWIAIGYTC